MKVGYYLTDYAGNGNLEGTASFYCLYDGQGNIVQISNKVGDVPYYLFRYDSYGNSLDIETNSNDSEMEPSGYKGYSESAIYFKTGVRHYDPDTGTFLSPDPFKGYLTDPQSQHPYMYCHGNPVKYSDPSGYEPCEIDRQEDIKTVSKLIRSKSSQLHITKLIGKGACLGSAQRVYRLLKEANLTFFEPIIVWSEFAKVTKGHSWVLLVPKTRVNEYKINTYEKPRANKISTEKQMMDGTLRVDPYLDPDCLWNQTYQECFRYSDIDEKNAIDDPQYKVK
jgi:RHS repeat-associated protein